MDDTLDYLHDNIWRDTENDLQAKIRQEVWYNVSTDLNDQAVRLIRRTVLGEIQREMLYG